MGQGLYRAFSSYCQSTERAVRDILILAPGDDDHPGAQKLGLGGPEAGFLQGDKEKPKAAESHRQEPLKKAGERSQGQEVQVQKLKIRALENIQAQPLVAGPDFGQVQAPVKTAVQAAEVRVQPGDDPGRIGKPGQEKSAPPDEILEDRKNRPGIFEMFDQTERKDSIGGLAVRPRSVPEIRIPEGALNGIEPEDFPAQGQTDVGIVDTLDLHSESFGKIGQPDRRSAADLEEPLSAPGLEPATEDSVQFVVKIAFLGLWEDLFQTDLSMPFIPKPLRNELFDGIVSGFFEPVPAPRPLFSHVRCAALD